MQKLLWNQKGGQMQGLSYFFVKQPESLPPFQNVGNDLLLFVVVAVHLLSCFWLFEGLLPY